MSYRRFNDERAQIIADAMAPLGPRRRVLDLGANDGWLSVRLAHAGHDVVAVEATDVARVPLDPSAPGTIEWIDRRVRVDDLPTLGEFDVVVALSVLHHFWRPVEAWRTLRRMARQLVVVEIPDPGEGTRDDKVAQWRALHDEVLATPGADPVLWLPGQKPASRRPLVVVPLERDPADGHAA